ncbi:hypothetical protein [Streptomyces sp. NPDC057428]|uniref:hypothetical protein n=1 Tax=Streptomyces sp. NPDC057428 TaxID=3346129 RepID=UPI0036818FD9
MPANADYDVSSIKIEPQALGSDSDKLIALANNVGDSVKRISDTVADLRVGWVSKSADEAQAFNDRWKHVMKQMFGEKDGETGVLPAMAGGILGTGVAFSHLELDLESAFRKFADALVHPQETGFDYSFGGVTGKIIWPFPTDQTGPEHPITQDFPNS